jgi:hypothetical protein
MISIKKKMHITAIAMAMVLFMMSMHAFAQYSDKNEVHLRGTWLILQNYTKKTLYDVKLDHRSFDIHGHQSGDFYAGFKEIQPGDKVYLRVSPNIYGVTYCIGEDDCGCTLEGSPGSYDYVCDESHRVKGGEVREDQKKVMRLGYW